MHCPTIIVSCNMLQFLGLKSAVARGALQRLWSASLLFLVKSCGRQESCLSPQGEFSPDGRIILTTTFLR